VVLAVGRGRRERDLRLVCDAPVLGLDFTVEQVPDATTLLHFWHLLEKHQLGRKLLESQGEILEEQGRIMHGGTIVDATIIAAPSSTKNAGGARDPEMRQALKGNQWYFGMKAHIGVDAGPGYVHSVTATAASVHDLDLDLDLRRLRRRCCGRGRGCPVSRSLACVEQAAAVAAGVGDFELVGDDPADPFRGVRGDRRLADDLRDPCLLGLGRCAGVRAIRHRRPLLPVGYLP
jgi:hypothetical protein